jgi:hypothetical protein
MRPLRLIARAAAGGLLVCALAATADARPDYLAKFQADPMRRAEVDGCGTCHVKKEGGGARNDFGTAFDAAGRDLTPLLRATFPQHFTVTSAKLPDGTTFFMSDPASKVVVIERQNQKVVVNVADIATPKAAPLPPSATRMTFFVTSRGVERGGQIGGLAGADAFCQNLAKAAGAGDRTWHAYLSTTFRKAPAVNAGDRIGSGPWHNAGGVLVARGPVDLHQRATLPPAMLLTEKGEAVPASVPVYTGTQANGMAALEQTCANWTSTSGEAAAGQAGGPWNASRTASCAPPAGGEAPRLYCFAVK